MRTATCVGVSLRLWDSASTGRAPRGNTGILVYNILKNSHTPTPRTSHAKPECDFLNLLQIQPDDKVQKPAATVLHEETHKRLVPPSLRTAKAQHDHERLRSRKDVPDHAAFQFVPFAVETCGFMGKEAVRFVNCLGDITAQSGRILGCIYVQGNATAPAAACCR